VKVAVGALGAALAASACCIGPVAFSLAGVGALGASLGQIEPYRPWFIAMTLLLVGVAMYGAYRPLPTESCAASACAPRSRRTPRVVVWAVAVAAALVVAFPYYIGWFV
jgi:mercuric ion transport protein